MLTRTDRNSTELRKFRYDKTPAFITAIRRYVERKRHARLDLPVYTKPWASDLAPGSDLPRENRFTGAEKAMLNEYAALRDSLYGEG